MSFELGNDRLDRSIRDQAQVSRAGRGMSRFRIELVSALMKIDLLISKGKRRAPAAEANFRHPQDGCVKGDRARDVLYREHKVVESGNLHCLINKGASLAAASHANVGPESPQRILRQVFPEKATACQRWRKCCPETAALCETTTSMILPCR